MKEKLRTLVHKSLGALAEALHSTEALEKVQIEHARDKAHGDYATNAALVLAKQAGCAPRELAQQIIDHLPADPAIQSVAIAGPGFINFTIAANAQMAILDTIHEQGERFGCHNDCANHRVTIEFVSSNPTGPLHVGHGRSAAYGSALANLLSAVGYQVHREYYVNDAGRQIDILTVSVWLRYLAQLSQVCPFPVNGYKGEYILPIAQELQQQHGKAFVCDIVAAYSDFPADEKKDEQGNVISGDKEAHIDAIIAFAKQSLGDDAYHIIHEFSLYGILSDIRQDLAEFGVEYDEWFSEASLVRDGSIERALQTLAAGHFTYEKEGAVWFKASELGDEQDRVLVRANGQTTYFASDVAYHLNKFERGADELIDVLGSDHHGYVPRVRAAISAMVGDAQRLKVPLIQFVSLYRGSEKMQMSTRSGSFVTLRSLREEVGNGATRFFYLMRKHEQHLDFDLELAKSQSNDNPVHYIQYAHARICSVLRQISEPGSGESVDRLTEPQETELVALLSRYPDYVKKAAQHYEPHIIAHYLRELATVFHAYYNAHHFLVEDTLLQQARLYLIVAVKQVLHNGLSLLGIQAIERM